MLQLLLFHSNNGCTNAPQLYLACYVHCLSFINYIVQVQYLYKILPAASITLHIKALNINITELWKAVDPINDVIMLLNLWLQCYYFCYNPVLTIVLYPQQNRACKINPFPARPFVVMYWTICTNVYYINWPVLHVWVFEQYQASIQDISPSSATSTSWVEVQQWLSFTVSLSNV